MLQLLAAVLGVQNISCLAKVLNSASGVRQSRHLPNQRSLRTDWKFQNWQSYLSLTSRSQTHESSPVEFKAYRTSLRSEQHFSTSPSSPMILYIYNVYIYIYLYVQCIYSCTAPQILKRPAVAACCASGSLDCASEGDTICDKNL